jgi:hypothetical protein
VDGHVVRKDRDALLGQLMLRTGLAAGAATSEVVEDRLQGIPGAAAGAGGEDELRADAFREQGGSLLGQ